MLRVVRRSCLPPIAVSGSPLSRRSEGCNDLFCLGNLLFGELPIQTHIYNKISRTSFWKRDVQSSDAIYAFDECLYARFFISSRTVGPDDLFMVKLAFLRRREHKLIRKNRILNIQFCIAAHQSSSRGRRISVDVFFEGITGSHHAAAPEVDAIID